MTPIDKRILGFIAGHHVLTLAVAKDNIPYCAHCFYAYIPGKNRFIFTSDPDTRHIRDAESSRNFYVTAGIALETKIIGKIRGLQLTGKMFLPEGRPESVPVEVPLRGAGKTAPVGAGAGFHEAYRQPTRVRKKGDLGGVFTD
jgi:hypothetical protein